MVDDMTQLPLFPSETDGFRAAGRRARLSFQGRGARRGPYLPTGVLVGWPPDPLDAPLAGAEPGPTGVRGWPRAAPGDPAWEHFGFVGEDVPRRARRDLVRQSRWTLSR